MIKKNAPPRFPLCFFRWFCHPDLLPSIEGDLLELFQERVANSGQRKAHWLFVWDVIRLFRLSIIKPSGGAYRMNQFGLIKNNIRTTYRFLGNHKTFTIINLIGLSIGILTSFYALLYVNFEMNYDRHHENSDHIYRMVLDVSSPTGVKKVSSAIPMAPVISEYFPQIKGYARVFMDYAMVQSSPDNFRREDYAYVDNSIFSVFTIPLLAGNAKTALKSPLEAVISESAAITYFGTTDCIGQSLIVDGLTTVTVSGVMQNMPEDSHFKVDILFSMKLLTELWNTGRKTNWKLFGCHTYLHLEEGVHTEILTHELSEIINQKIDDADANYTVVLEPLTSLYLYADARGYRTGISQTGNLDYVYIVGVIGMLVLFIAGFNFINLSTALSLNRVKEISIRKVLGADKGQLRFQFLLDAVLLSLLAFTVSSVLFWLSAHYFNELAGKTICATGQLNISHLGCMLILSLAVGLLSGVYPAVFLSNFKTQTGLKGRYINDLKGSIINKSLIVGQFATSIFLIAFAIGIYQQLIFIRNTDIGYDRNQKLTLDFFFDENIKRNEGYVRRELLTLPGVSKVSFSSTVPGRTERRFDTKIIGVSGDLVEFEADLHWINPDYLDQYKIPVVAGRTFSANIKSDINTAILLNETAVKVLGYHDPVEVIGKKFQQRNRGDGTVIGVVKDYHNFSLKEEILPMTFRYAPEHYTFLTLTLSDKDTRQTIQALKDKWIELKPKRPFDYAFADESYASKYEAENRLGQLVLFFSLVAILISNLGLLGICTYHVAQKTKEVGIRKVLGASVYEIMKTFGKSFMSLVALGFLISIPISWYSMNLWLQDFAYRIEIAWWVFALAGFGASLIAFLTISSQSIKAAMSNPIDSLRDE